jgi:hypothetical protein
MGGIAFIVGLVAYIVWSGCAASDARTRTVDVVENVAFVTMAVCAVLILYSSCGSRADV